MNVPEYRLSNAAQKIKRWQRIAGLKGNTIAKEAGISAAYYSDISRGKQRGSIEVLARIAAVLGHSLNDLFEKPHSQFEGQELKGIDLTQLKQKLQPHLEEDTDAVLDCLELWLKVPDALYQALEAFHQYGENP